MTIKVYIDTNVYLNAIEKRDGDISLSVITFLEAKDIMIFVNDLTIINIHYITRKSVDRVLIKSTIKTILSRHHLVSIDRNIIFKSLDSLFGDFEDGLQYFCA